MDEDSSAKEECAALKYRRRNGVPVPVVDLVVSPQCQRERGLGRPSLRHHEGAWTHALADTTRRRRRKGGNSGGFTAWHVVELRERKKKRRKRRGDRKSKQIYRVSQSVGCDSVGRRRRINSSHLWWCAKNKVTPSCSFDHHIHFGNSGSDLEGSSRRHTPYYNCDSTDSNSNNNKCDNNNNNTSSNPNNISHCDSIRGANSRRDTTRPGGVIPALSAKSSRRQREGHPKSKEGTTTTTTTTKLWSHHRRWFSFPSSTTRLVGNVILLSFISHLTASYTAASPSPSSSSSSSHLYHLLPPSPNSSVFIHFNPPFIRNLRVNTRERVFFNFTIIQRNGRFPSLSQPNESDDESSPNKGHSRTSNTNNDDDNNISSSNSNGGGGGTIKTTSTTTFLTKNVSGHARPGSSLSTPPSSPLLQSNNQDAQSLSLSVTTPADSTTNVSEVKVPSHGHRGGYRVMVFSSDDNVAFPVGPESRRPEHKGQRVLDISAIPGTQYSFLIEGKRIGTVRMSVAVVDLANDKVLNMQPRYVQAAAVAASQYSVTTVRGERTADTVFDSAAAAIAMLISFGMGASTEVDCLKRQLKYPVALVIAFCCQFIMMPLMAFGIAMALPLKDDISFGLLCVACVPGGGLGHVAVIIADGDTALSMTINLISVVAMLVTAPLWIFVLGQYFHAESDAALNPRMIPWFNFEVWLVSSFVAYMVGLLIKRFRPVVADAILMWLIKPILLLASILYITLGVYINMYVFNLVKEFALLGAVLLPFCGCLLGGLVAAICRQGNAFVRTIALETASLNCLVVLVALRFSLQQPNAADMATMIPIWVMFTIPGLFVFLAIVNKVKATIMHYWNRRNLGSGDDAKDPELLGSSKAYSVSSSVVSPPGTTTLSAPLVVADGVDDDLTISTMSNQKVTVL